MSAQKVQQHPVVVQAQNKLGYYHSQLDKELTNYPILLNLERKTQIPKTYAVLAASFLVVFLHLFNPLAAPISNLVGWVIPAYLSFKALETPSAQDDIQWLTYWVVFGFFNFLESFALSVLLYYLPWYFAFKTIFILWLQLPAFRGAQTTYHTLLKPVFANVSNSTVVRHTETSAEVLRERAGAATE
ncbi:hypothetical protein E1B28_009762 [Marasmius oreades]|uniref:Protein YOP1 n=1 Tax=Marasmius oreades TaxID=181124 RepID=A0A9P7UQT3_9AGAR|nr:uncharacterized protein E1B28_009762 [Marasmius oreades]KAG7090663.1 hypothetical protein E1B28_009762 [Marasmius oreades]